MNKLVLFLVLLVSLSLVVSSYNVVLNSKSTRGDMGSIFEVKTPIPNKAIPLIIKKNITIVTYNVLNFGESGVERVEYFRKVIDEIDPDILVVQEMNVGGVDIFLDDVMNYGEEEYLASPFIDGPSTDNIIFYKPTKIEYLETEQIPTESRDISAYTLSLVDKHNSEFIIYSVHLHPGQYGANKILRYNEVLELKEHADNLPEGSHFMVLGDFNIYEDVEPVYELLMEEFVIDLYDPINQPGDWHDHSEFAEIHTQATRSIQFGGGAYGGLDDRFDMILLSQSFENHLNLEYINNSYHAFGNDGEHFNQAINEGENSVVSVEIADALHYASDHLPVVAKFQYRLHRYALRRME